MQHLSFHKIPLRTLLNGDKLHLTYFHFKGKSKDAPKVYIQANVHGAELQGNQVILNLIEEFKNKRPLGDVVIVPQANPYGVNQKIGEYTYGRFDPTTGENWNRNYYYFDQEIESFFEKSKYLNWDKLKVKFKKYYQSLLNMKQKESDVWGMSYGKKLALILQKMAFSADIVLDLHTGPDSAEHLYVADYAFNDGKKLNFPLNIIIPTDFAGAMDECFSAPWSKLFKLYQEHHNTNEKLNQFSYTVELGSQEEIDSKSGLSQTDRILNYLNSHKVISLKDERPIKKTKRYYCDLEDYKLFFAPEGGLYEFKVSLNKEISSKTSLCHYYHFNTNKSYMPKEISLDQNIIMVLRYDSSSVHEGDELFRAMTNYKKY